MNTEAPEIEGWKRRKGETASSIMQGGQDTLELEGTRDAEAKGFATMIEAPEADNKVTATTGDTKTDLQDMEGGSGTTAIDSGKINNNNASIDLDMDTFKRIRDMERGARPDPSTYLTSEQMNAHLKQFEGGVTKITPKVPEGQVGPPGGTFVMPKSVADDIILAANGDIRKLEILLGLDIGILGDNPVRIDVSNPMGLRISSGNELGANSQWIPGGKTKGGILEATIEPAMPGTYTFEFIK